MLPKPTTTIATLALYRALLFRSIRMIADGLAAPCRVIGNRGDPLP